MNWEKRIRGLASFKSNAPSIANWYKVESDDVKSEYLLRDLNKEQVEFYKKWMKIIENVKDTNKLCAGQISDGIINRLTDKLSDGESLSYFTVSCGVVMDSLTPEIDPENYGTDLFDLSLSTEDFMSRFSFFSVLTEKVPEAGNALNNLKLVSWFAPNPSSFKEKEKRFALMTELVGAKDDDADDPRAVDLEIEVLLSELQEAYKKLSTIDNPDGIVMQNFEIINNFETILSRIIMKYILCFGAKKKDGAFIFSDEERDSVVTNVLNYISVYPFTNVCVTNNKTNKMESMHLTKNAISNMYSDLDKYVKTLPDYPAKTAFLIDFLNWLQSIKHYTNKAGIVEATKSDKPVDYAFYDLLDGFEYGGKSQIFSSVDYLDYGVPKFFSDPESRSIFKCLFENKVNYSEFIMMTESPFAEKNQIMLILSKPPYNCTGLTFTEPSSKEKLVVPNASKVKELLAGMKPFEMSEASANNINKAARNSGLSATELEKLIADRLAFKTWLASAASPGILKGLLTTLTRPFTDQSALNEAIDDLKDKTPIITDNVEDTDFIAPISFTEILITEPGAGKEPKKLEWVPGSTPKRYPTGTVFTCNGKNIEVKPTSTANITFYSIVELDFGQDTKGVSKSKVEEAAPAAPAAPAASSAFAPAAAAAFGAAATKAHIPSIKGVSEYVTLTGPAEEGSRAVSPEKKTIELSKVRTILRRGMPIKRDGSKVAIPSGSGDVLIQIGDIIETKAADYTVIPDPPAPTAAPSAERVLPVLTIMKDNYDYNFVDYSPAQTTMSLQKILALPTGTMVFGSDDKEREPSKDKMILVKVGDTIQVPGLGDADDHDMLITV